MFEEAPLSASSPGVDPAAGRLAAWHPERGEWVAVEPCDMVDPVLEAVLGELAREYAAVPAAGVLLVDVDEVPVGPELAGQLATFDPSTADAHDLVEAAAGLERLEAWVAARKAAVHAALASRPQMRPDHTGYRSVNPVTNTAMEIAGRRHLTVKQAENQVGHAQQLVLDFPATHVLFEAGLIDLRRARVIADELGGQDLDVRERVEAAVLPTAPYLDSVALRKLIRRLLHELAPVKTAERHRAARDRRYVAMSPASDGMAHLEALLSAEDATALNTALNAAAADAKRADAAAGRPPRTKDQRRADALADLGWAALAACTDAAGTATGHAGTGHQAADAGQTEDAGQAEDAGRAAGVGTVGGRAASGGVAGWFGRLKSDGGTRRLPISVHLTVPFATAVGLSDQPGELEGYGPIPAHVARTLAAQGVWTWLRKDPGTGQILDLGRTKYRPTTALAEFITARDQTCRAPGCHRPARTCDIDHIIAFTAGGSTSPDNLHTLCTTHHLLKHHGHWTVHRPPDGTTVWRSPTGHHYRKPPGPIGPVAATGPPVPDAGG
ncbi:HNH endonuclease [Jiangella aurantiaca]|uniref:HNH endonuclease n=1 Tax=Jiangella aurantiaca TaxID=2530373 RepID=A0A4R5AHS1_9ACTN|nr:HNH endonuclease signature motif containing protein [Jiangella aurantiaca]TDD69632.1 HNH endonuclease [Jiangella aurantiaca]